VEKKENEAEGMKKGLLVGQLARVDGQHSDHVSNERENGRSRFLLERMCIPIFTLLTFVFSKPFSLSGDYSFAGTLCAGCFGIPGALVPRSSSSRP
jgi:hypothetical protein